MKFTVEIEGDLDQLMRREVLEGARAVKTAMTGAGEALKANWRAQVGAALSNRLANAVRSKVYPKAGNSLNAAALVYAQPNRKPTASAADLLDVFDRGAMIRSASGFWLAIPLPAAGKGSRGARMTPAMWEQKTGRKLTFVYRKGKSGLLVDTGTKRAGNVLVRRRVRGGTKYADPVTFRNRTIPIFALVRQVKLPKRLDLFPAAERVAAAVPGNIVANWRE